MNQSLNLYYIFYMVCECGNLSEAARKLYISQPAVSKSIAKLEEELNTKLLHRTTRGVLPTEAGALLKQQLSVAFQAIEQGEHQLRRMIDTDAGHLTIGVSTTLCKYVLLPYLKNFVEAYPNIKISIRCQSSHETVEALKDGTLDIGLIGEADHLEGLHFKPYLQIRDGFVVTEQYLKQIGKEQSDSFSELLKTGVLLLLDPNNYSRKYVDQHLSAQNLNCDRIMEISTMDLLLDFTKADFGIGCVITDFVQKDIAEGRLIKLDTDHWIPPRNIGFAYSSMHPISDSMKRFLAELQS